MDYEIQKLEDFISATDFNYTLVFRFDCPLTDRSIAIVEQRTKSGIFAAYETHEIQKQRKPEIGPGGVMYPPKERLCGGSMFGQSAWSVGLYSKDLENTLIPKEKRKAYATEKSLLRAFIYGQELVQRFRESWGKKNSGQS